VPTRTAIIWSPRALDRVEEAARYIAQDRPGAALRWVDEIFARVDLLAVAPKQGRVVPELERAEIREIFFGRYRVIYRIEAGRVLVLTVRHSRRLFDPSEVEDQ
jgi:plasmid stabilization system protein ParE